MNHIKICGFLICWCLHGAVLTEVNVHTAAAVVVARELGTRATDWVAISSTFRGVGGCVAPDP